MNPIAVLSEIHFPFVLSWSPDSKIIAFIGEYGYFKENGIWLYSLENNSVVKVGKGKFQDILWADDSKSLFAIQCDNNLYCSTIEEFDLRNIMR